MLSSSFSDDWSRNDKETWDKKKLGSCKTKAFDPCKGFDVAIKKKVGKKDSFKVSNLTLELSKADEKTPSAKYIIKYHISSLNKCPYSQVRVPELRGDWHGHDQEGHLQPRASEQQPPVLQTKLPHRRPAEADLAHTAHTHQQAACITNQVSADISGM